jgi:hypothetical protein
MKIQICLDRQELHGLQAAKFEVYDSNDVNQGALFVGKGGIRWQEPKQPGGRARSKSWQEVIKWLREHGRPVKL